MLAHGRADCRLSVHGKANGGARNRSTEESEMLVGGAGTIRKRRIRASLFLDSYTPRFYEICGHTGESPNRHITIEPDGALLEERIFKQTSKRAEAEKSHSGATPTASPISQSAPALPHVRDHGGNTHVVDDKVEERIQRLQHRLTFLLGGSIPGDHELYAWSMAPAHV